MRAPSRKEIFLYSALLTVLIEAVTVLFRFGLGLQASTTTSAFGRLTGGLRIHHGFIGLAVIIATAALMRRYPVAARWALVLGIALVASDLVHHLLVLWPITGSPELELFYPGP